MRRALAAVVSGALLVVGSGLPAAARTAIGPHGGPPLTVAAPVLASALQCTTPSRSTGKRPVLLVHGTGLTPAESWAWNYAKVLPDLGYPTCTVALPDAALGDIQVAAEYVVYAVDAMSSRWHSEVDVIGHSQGGLEPRWALRWWPGLRTKVDHYVGLASPNHGIYAADACADSGNCWPAVWQMAQGSHFLDALNSVSQAPGPTSYTDIYSLTDELVQPALPDPTAALPPAPNVSNVAVQSICPGRYVNHAGLLADAVVFALVIDALDHNGPVDPAWVPASVCAEQFIPGVSPAAALTGNALVYVDAARAFESHPGVRQEPPLAPYAKGPYPAGP
jgi:triacylglycerol esterase/lipase EstA (alpha/beta hydrolase family)